MMGGETLCASSTGVMPRDLDNIKGSQPACCPLFERGDRNDRHHGTVAKLQKALVLKDRNDFAWTRGQARRLNCDVEFPLPQTDRIGTTGRIEGSPTETLLHLDFA